MELDGFNGKWIGDKRGVVIAAREAQEFYVYHFTISMRKPDFYMIDML